MPWRRVLSVIGYIELIYADEEKGRREEPCALGGEAQLQDNLGAGRGW